MFDCVMGVIGWLVATCAHPFLYPLGYVRKSKHGEAVVVTKHDNPRCAFIYFHGNAGTAGEEHWLARAATATVYAPEYPGYGTHTDQRPSELGLYAAAQLAWQRAVDDGFAEDRIYIWGHSLGSGPATWLAAQHPRCGGLVLHAGFASAISVLSLRIGAWARYLGVDLYDVASTLRGVNCPVAFVHAKQDNLIVPAHAGVNAKSVRGMHNTWWFDGHHASIPDEEMTQAVVDWLTNAIE